MKTSKKFMSTFICIFYFLATKANAELFSKKNITDRELQRDLIEKFSCSTVNECGEKNINFRQFKNEFEKNENNIDSDIKRGFKLAEDIDSADRSRSKLALTTFLATSSLFFLMMESQTTVLSSTRGENLGGSFLAAAPITAFESLCITPYLTKDTSHAKRQLKEIGKIARFLYCKDKAYYDL